VRRTLETFKRRPTFSGKIFIGTFLVRKDMFYMRHKKMFSNISRHDYPHLKKQPFPLLCYLLDWKQRHDWEFLIEKIPSCNTLRDFIWKLKVLKGQFLAVCNPLACSSVSKFFCYPTWILT
jgi:hypothetical protein